MTRASVTERLERMSMPEPNSGCVLWLGSLDDKGYGRIRQPGKTSLAHKVAYELYVGPVPDGMELDHLCRNPACRAVWHLEPVTHRVNLLRGVGPAAKNAAKTVCVNGHPFDDANTYRKPRGWRECRICRANARRRRSARPHTEAAS
jgi:hypothetical protein